MLDKFTLTLYHHVHVHTVLAHVVIPVRVTYTTTSFGLGVLPIVFLVLLHTTTATFSISKSMNGKSADTTDKKGHQRDQYNFMFHIFIIRCLADFLPMSYTKELMRLGQRRSIVGIALSVVALVVLVAAVDAPVHDVVIPESVEILEAPPVLTEPEIASTSGSTTTTPIAPPPVVTTPAEVVAGEEVTRTGPYAVVTVVDGDTIDVLVAGKPTRVRYIGINTPETVHPTRGAECFGTEASAKNKALVAGQWVELEKDVSETDKYGRLLRYVYVNNVMVNEALVAEGYANVSTYPPDVRHTERFRAAEAAARSAGKGLWGTGCEVYQRPSSEEGDAGAMAAAPAANACTIKGNIAQGSGERIYHVPGCTYYDRTVIAVADGERWFCSEEEAVAAGWRKAQNCPL
jgi:micrococcal nuclease